MGIMLGDPSALSSYIAGSYSDELPLSFSAKSDEPYYMIRLRKLITFSLLRFGTVYFLLAFFTFGLFVFPLIPISALITYKYHLFLLHLKNYNYKTIVFWSVMGIWYILCFIRCFAIRSWLFSLFRY